MGKNLLVAGIDPGTTTAVAVIDLNTRKVLFLDSSRDFTLSKVISVLVDIGKVVAVGSDKKNMPSFSQKIATKLGARAVHPMLDLSVREKRDLTRSFRSRNNHEQDALASALHAYDKIKYLLDKINHRVMTKHKERLSESIKEIVIKKEGTSFAQAVERLEKPARKTFVRTTANQPAEETEYTKLLHRYNKMKKDLKIKAGLVDMLKQSISRKNQLIRNLKNDVEKVKARKIDKERRDKLLDFKEKRIHIMQDKIDSLNKLNDELKKQIMSKGLMDRVIQDYRRSRN